jgi:hypothetical protein
MTASFTVMPAPPSKLSEAQVADLNAQLLDELDRFNAPGCTEERRANPGPNRAHCRCIEPHPRRGLRH